MPTGGWNNNNVPMEERDFDWFRQSGNVYSDKNKSPFTKYTNLHLGLAYEKMTPKDYYYKVEHRGEQVEAPDDGVYRKNLIESGVQKSLSNKAKMIDCGYEALYDAFCVIKNEKLFNIFNSKTNVI